MNVPPMVLMAENPDCIRTGLDLTERCLLRIAGKFFPRAVGDAHVNLTGNRVGESAELPSGQLCAWSRLEINGGKYLASRAEEE